MKTPTARLRRLDQRGYSLVELMFVVGIAGIAIASIVRFTFATRVSLSRQEVSTDLYSTNARIGSNLRRDLSSAQLLLANYNGGSPGNLSTLMACVRASAQAGGAPAPVSFTQPAVVTALNDPDLSGTASTTWGNEIMYVARLNPVTFTVQDQHVWDATYCTCTSSTLAVERYQFVYDYLTDKATPNVPGLGPALRLVQWRSGPIVDYAMLDVSNSGRTYMALSETTATLLAWGYNTVFDIRSPQIQAISTSFYVILTATAQTTNHAFVAANNTNSLTLPTSSWAFMDDYDAMQAYYARPNVNLGRRSLSGTYGGVASPYTMSIAYNNTGTGLIQEKVLDAPGKHLSVPLYAKADLSTGFGGGPGFPGGFEVAIMGPNGQRQVYVRHVLMSSGGARPGTPSKTYMAHEATDEATVWNFGY